MSAPAIPPDDVAASLRAGRDLGPDYDDAIAASLAERLEQTIDERVRHHLADVAAQQPAAPQRKSNTEAWKSPRLIMGIIAMGVLIPLSAIAGAIVGPAGILMSWIGVVVIYVIAVVGIHRA
ncbi:hypothetical protein ACFOVU_08130 [Nocardiopsis sediminis]|uniref:DUF1707 domain-containing protein n=1 Tax=Nocardiopsis sediminis TaxID=1778267 RepID=A0ABV8FLM3_9ACTN